MPDADFVRVADFVVGGEFLIRRSVFLCDSGKGITALDRVYGFGGRRLRLCRRPGLRGRGLTGDFDFLTYAYEVGVCDTVVLCEFLVCSAVLLGDSVSVTAPPAYLS